MHLSVVRQLTQKYVKGVDRPQRQSTPSCLQYTINTNDLKTLWTPIVTPQPTRENAPQGVIRKIFCKIWVKSTFLKNTSEKSI